MVIVMGLPIANIATKTTADKKRSVSPYGVCIIIYFGSVLCVM